MSQPFLQWHITLQADKQHDSEKLNLMQPVKTHSTAFNQGQQFVMNSHTVSMPSSVHSVLILTVLSHTHALWLTAPLLLFLSLGGLLEPLYFGLSTASQKAESLQLIGTPAPLGCHSGSCTAPSSLLLHFLPLPSLLFSRYIITG